MNSFAGRLFAKGVALAGEDCVAYFSANALYVDGFTMVPVDRLSTRVGGFNHNKLFFHWQDEQGNDCSFMPSSESEVKNAIGLAPSELQAHFKEWRYRTRSISVIWISIISVIVVTMLAGVLLWWKYDEALTWVASHISVQNEQALGEAFFTQMQAENEFISEGDAHAVVVEIGTLLSKNSTYEYKWHIAKDSQINAYAVPGGIIVINSGLLTAIEGPDELAAVIAHEIQHIEQRHSLKNMINSVGWASALLILLGDANVATAVVIHQLGSMYFGRDKEEEADRLGLELLIENDINPNGMVTLLRRFETSDGVEIPDWLSSHPATSDRINHIEEQIVASACSSCTSLDFNWDVIKDDPLLGEFGEVEE